MQQCRPHAIDHEVTGKNMAYGPIAFLGQVCSSNGLANPCVPTASLLLP
jgi:hypothetical protein